MLTYIAPNLIVNLNDVDYPLHRVGCEGYMDRVAADGTTSPVNFMLWADTMADAKGGFVLCLHMWRPNTHEEQRMVHVLGAGGNKRYATMEEAVAHCASIAGTLLFKEVPYTHLLKVLQARILSIVVGSVGGDPQVEVPDGANIH